MEKDADPYDGNPWRYCGEYWDQETGTYYLRARYYDPVIGRFLAEDTHWNPGNMVYGDDPVKWNERETDENDPLGLNTYTYKPDMFAIMQIEKWNEHKQDEDSQLVLNTYIYRPDVMAIMQSGNLYAYCVGNPVTHSDPSGLVVVIDDIVFWSVILIIVAGGSAVVASDPAFMNSFNQMITGMGNDFASLSRELDNFLNASKKDKAKGKTKQPSKESDKERATDIPSWAKGTKPKPGQNGKDYAKDQMDAQYGEGNWEGNPRRESEYSKLKKYGDRGAR